MMKLKFTIKAKILLSLLLLSLATFTTVTALALINMKKLSDYAVEISSSLGKDAVKKSNRALLAQASEELQALVAGQAEITDLQLHRIAEETEMFSSLTKRFLDEGFYGPQFEVQKNKQYFLTDIPRGMSPSGMSTHSFVAGPSLALQQQQLKKCNSMHFIMKYLLGSNQNQDLIYVGLPSGLFMGYPWHKVPKGYDPRKRQWYTNAQAAKGKITWSGPYVSASNNKLVLTCSKAIYGSNKKLLAVCSIDLDVKEIFDNFLSTKLAPECSAFMIDSSGRMLTAQGISDHGLNWKSDYRTQDLLKTGNARFTDIINLMIAGKFDMKRFHIDGGSLHYIAFAPIKVTKWSIGIMIPRRNIVAAAKVTKDMIRKDTERHNQYLSRYIRNNRMVYFLVGLMMLAIIIVIGMILSRKITDPILYLKQQAIEIGSVNLGKRIELHTGDELEELAETFNRMTQDLKNYIVNLGETVAAKEKIERELGVAYEIQTSMLPSIFPPFPQCPDVDIFAIMDPAKEVGGDLYDFFMVDDRYLYFCIGDVSGKGVPAALFMAITKTLLAHEAARTPDPSEIFMNVNNAIEKDNDACMFATAFCGMMDAKTGEIKYSNAGHNPPLIYREDLGFSFLDPEKGIPLGVCFMQDGVCKREELLLGRGDILFMYSDGVTEAMNEDGEMFGEARLLEELNNIADLPLTEMLHQVREALRVHAGFEPQSDDISMLALKRSTSLEQ
jgi:phosphoserine phosphatase RsbU/P